MGQHRLYQSPVWIAPISWPWWVSDLTVQHLQSRNYTHSLTSWTSVSVLMDKSELQRFASRRFEVVFIILQHIPDMYISINSLQKCPCTLFVLHSKDVYPVSHNSTILVFLQAFRTFCFQTHIWKIPFSSLHRPVPMVLESIRYISPADRLFTFPLIAGLLLTSTAASEGPASPAQKIEP